MSRVERRANPAMLMAAASAILLLTMGVRQLLGLFVLPIVTATGVSLVSVSFALAIGQFVWGAAQPLFGAVVDRLRRVSGTDLGRRAVGRGRCAGDPELIGFWVRTDPGDFALRRHRGWELRDSHRSDHRIAASGKALARGRHHQRGRIARTALVRTARATGHQRLGLAHGHARDIARCAAHRSDRVAVPRPVDRWRGRTFSRGERADHEIDRPARAIAGRPARSELPVPERGILHLRISHCISRDAPAGQFSALRTVRDGRGQFARVDRRIQCGRQLVRRLARTEVPHEKHSRLVVREPCARDRMLFVDAEDGL